MKSLETKKNEKKIKDTLKNTEGIDLKTTREKGYTKFFFIWLGAVALATGVAFLINNLLPIYGVNVFFVIFLIVNIVKGGKYL